MATISGILKDPIGQPMTNCTIELKSQRTTVNVLRTMTSNFDTLVAGAYTMDVYSGIYDVILRSENKAPQFIGTITVFDNSDDGSLNDFLMLSNPAEFGSATSKKVEELTNDVMTTNTKLSYVETKTETLLTRLQVLEEAVNNQSNSVSGPFLPAFGDVGCIVLARPASGNITISPGSVINGSSLILVNITSPQSAGMYLGSPSGTNGSLQGRWRAYGEVKRMTVSIELTVSACLFIRVE